MSRRLTPVYEVRCPMCLAVRKVRGANPSNYPMAADGVLERKCGSCGHRLETCKYGHALTADNRSAAGRCCQCIRDRSAAARAADYADPVKGPKLREYYRIYLEGRRRARGIEPRQWGERSNRLPKAGAPAPSEAFPVGPLLRFIDAYLKATDDEIGMLCQRAQTTSRTVAKWRTGDVSVVSLSVADRLLVAMGEPPHTLHALYPIEGGPEVELVLPEPPPRRLRGSQLTAEQRKRIARELAAETPEYRPRTLVAA